MKNIEKQLINHLTIDVILNIRQVILNYIDENEIDVENPFEKDKCLILSYLRLLRKRKVYLSDRHCKRYKQFAIKNGILFDNEFWKAAICIENNQSDFLYLLSLWKQQIMQLENLWNDTINHLLFELYKKLLDEWNCKYGVHHLEQLISNIESLDFSDEQELSYLLDKNDIGLPLDIDNSSEQDDVIFYQNDIINYLNASIEDIIKEEGFGELLSNEDADTDTDTGKSFSKGYGNRKLTSKDKLLFLSWERKISKDKNIKHLLDIIGRGMKIDSGFKSGSNMFGELSGLKLGKDIQTVLPSELVQISHPELSYLFDLKYLEEKLLSFELNTPIFQDKKNYKQGAMIICLDTSASMETSLREYVAKAVTYYLASNAVKQKRSCFIINFSEEIVSFDVRTEPRKLAQFLSYSFGYGTDVEPAIKQALNILKTYQYKNADVLIVSDFFFANIENELKIDIEKQQKKGTRFNALIVDSYHLCDNIPLDDIWSIDRSGNARILNE